MDLLLGKKSRAATSLQTHHFLNNVRQYQSCKHALEKLTIVQIYLDLNDISACSHLAALLQTHGAQFSICNFTNIHQYLNTEHLFATTNALLAFSNPDAVIFSTGPCYRLNVFCAASVQDYYTVLKNAHIPRSEYSPKMFGINLQQRALSIDTIKSDYQLEPSNKGSP